MTEELHTLARQLGHHFHNPALLEQALSHCSNASKPNNERLEFLGDAILELVISNALYQQQKKATEGELSRMRSTLVNRDVLARLAQHYHIDQFMLVGASESSKENGISASMLADAMEAIIAAIYLDAGFATCQQCVEQWYQAIIGDLGALKPVKDAKTQLQETLQAKKYPLPDYAMTTSGKGNALRFHVTCTVTGLAYQSIGNGNNRRKAEQLAAAQYLEYLNEKYK